jgi:hypothetical protein
MFLPLAVLLAGVAHAAPTFRAPTFVQTEVVPTDDKPWYSLDNLSIAAGVGWRWQPEINTVNGPKDEAIVGLYNAWQLTMHVDAIGNVKYGVDSGKSEFEVGVRVILKMPK